MKRGLIALFVVLFVVLGASCGASDPPARPVWDKGLPSAAVMGAVRGLEPARGIIHLHSPYSHDACDGDPRGASGLGPVDEACLADLRQALCTDRIDFAALTDHDDSMADEDFASLFVMRDGDQAVTVDGHQVASRITCGDGHQVLVTVGGENEIMPIMLDGHVAGDIPTRHATYNGDDATAVAAMRAAGATIWIAHSEQRTTAHLAELAPDGIELYNLHANLDPSIRETYLGLPAAGAITAVAEFADTSDLELEPDLALISFLSASGPALDRWNELLAAGHHLAASAGTDAHENALPIVLADDERGDSYRRMMRWFANIALVTDAADPVAIEDAVRRGQSYVAFELFGTPVGFDAAMLGGAAPGGPGALVPDASGLHYDVTVPTIYRLDPSLPAPEIRARILYISAAGVTELASGPGPIVTAPYAGIGAYRAEITIRPRHLGPYLGHVGAAVADQELPWIYGNPTYVVSAP
ncbi:MAG: hypothetical protein K8W52_25510 [Deltaproteobacteria bacterium]|nr:hypothetical protein [Deltaproteobacteria bacterium]